MTIKDLPLCERPREKLINKGPKNVPDYDLMAILLRTGRNGTDVISMSKKILGKHSMQKLLSLSFEDLIKIKGIDSGKACSLLAAFELTKRALNNFNNNLPLIENPQDAVDLVSNLTRLKKEHFVALYLNARNQVIEKETISIGTLTGTMIHPREVFEPAIRNLAAQIILSHNHPSGSLEPSDEDEEITKRLVKAGKIMGIEIMDHLIVTKNGWFSFREEGFFDDKL
jgi:DNA repair protein RadC